MRADTGMMQNQQCTRSIGALGRLKTRNNSFLIQPFTCRDKNSYLNPYPHETWSYRPSPHQHQCWLSQLFSGMINSKLLET